MEIFLTHPLLSVIIVIVLVIVGKYLYVSKDDGIKLKNDINNLGAKSDNCDAELEKKFDKAIHETELKFTEKLGEHSEKIRIVQKEILDEANEKFFSKEMAMQHDDRIANLEEMMRQILPRLEKIDLLYELIQDKK